MAKGRNTSNYFQDKFGARPKERKITNKQFEALPSYNDINKAKVERKKKDGFGQDISGLNRQRDKTTKAQGFTKIKDAYKVAKNQKADDKKAKKPYTSRDNDWVKEEKNKKKNYSSAKSKFPRERSSEYERPERIDSSERKRKTNQNFSAKENQFKRKTTEDYADSHVKQEKKYKQEPKRLKQDHHETMADRNEMPLNKYVAKCGTASRRETVNIIKDGRVHVNGKLILDPAYKVLPKDKVTLDGKKLTIQRDLVYILLNKPKDFITTLSDEKGRKTVMHLVANACEERIYPVGRLDRNTSGLLLLTNDGELTQKLSHPKFNVQKLYQVNLDKDLSKKDFDAILKGVKLEDGIAEVDQLAYADAKDKSIIGIQIHSGKNRIVRRIFESLGYVVKQLDRVMYANLTKKNLPRGKYRFLTEAEIRYLKYYNSSKK